MVTRLMISATKHYEQDECGSIMWDLRFTLFLGISRAHALVRVVERFAKGFMKA